MTDAEKREVLRWSAYQYLENFGSATKDAITLQSLISKGMDASYEDWQSIAKLIIPKVDASHLCPAGQRMLRDACRAADIIYIWPKITMQVVMQNIPIANTMATENFRVTVTTKDGTVLYEGEPTTIRGS